MLGWDALDVILVTGDSYIDSPFIGVSLIGKVLIDAGYRVGIVAQPEVNSDRDICRLGEPRVCWGITAGCMDSMVANYTASGKKRRQDDLTPGGVNNRRPDRAVIAYCNLIRRFFKKTVPLVIGGVEASLRRITHYDFWSDKLRKSILCDSKANYLVYGMGEQTILDLVAALSSGESPCSIRGLCYLNSQPHDSYLELPSHESVQESKKSFIEMFHLFYQNGDPVNGQGLYQKQDTRYLIQNPPAPYLSQQQLDRVYGLDFERNQHPYYEQQGKVRAQETIRFSITSHRGCYGECNFCAVSMHQGRQVRWRSEKSIIAEARRLSASPGFKGIITDVGGPTANMYGFECKHKAERGPCRDKRCLFPSVCANLPVSHKKQLDLLQKILALPSVKKVFIGSGIRYDLICSDTNHGHAFLEALVKDHISGQMKVAPEHSDAAVLELMGKPDIDILKTFRSQFNELNRKHGKKQFLTYYFIAAHPGCSDREMHSLKHYINTELHISPEQIQIFTPTPSTYSSLMYYTGLNPFTLDKLFVERGFKGKSNQKKIISK